MELSSYFPIWDQLTPAQQAQLARSARLRTAPRGTLLHNGSEDCVGLLAVCSGALRAFIRSPEGREVTIYRLFERDICLFSASCMLKSAQFDVSVEVERDARLWIIPADIYQSVAASSAALANYTSELMASRFSDVMWLVEQILWRSQDRRLASFLLDESALQESRTLSITHDRIAAHMGTAREVVTRLLRYLQGEGMVRLARGTIELIDEDRLRAWAEE